MKFKDVPLSNVDLLKWCEYLGIPPKGIFPRNEVKPVHHSPCIINLDDVGSLGTHWVACWPGPEYFDSFGLPPPDEWEKEMRKAGYRTFLRNNEQIQWIGSVRCGYYCLLFLNARHKGTPYKDILKMFSGDIHRNEEVVKNYFLNTH